VEVAKEVGANQDFAIMGGTIPVAGFTEEQAVRFLRARSGRPDEENANDLAHELDMMPLALAQAGWVMRQRALSVTEYLASFRSSPLRATLPQVPGDGYPRCLEDATLWALEEVEKADEIGLVRILLESVALLSPSGVHRALLHELGSVETDVDAGLGVLARTSLIGFDVSGRIVAMHRLTRRVVVGRAEREERLRSDVMVVVAALTKTIDGERPIEEIPQECVDHIQHLWAVGGPLLAGPAKDATTTSLLRLRRWTVRRLVSAGEFAKAIEIGKAALEEHESGRWQAGDSIRAMRLALRRAYIVADRFSDAITLSEQHLADCLHRFGEADERTLNARNSLGYDCECAGQLDRAMAIHRLNLAESIRFLGPDHQVVMYARVNLASTYRSAGECDQATEAFEENLRENLRVHGESHASTINARGELARTYVRVGRPRASLCTRRTACSWPAQTTSTGDLVAQVPRDRLLSRRTTRRRDRTTARGVQQPRRQIPHRPPRSDTGALVPRQGTARGRPNEGIHRTVPADGRGAREGAGS
jgi:tetratricopeptide (TPR) repeat protein